MQNALRHPRTMFGSNYLYYDLVLLVFEEDDVDLWWNVREEDDKACGGLFGGKKTSRETEGYRENMNIYIW